MSLWDLENELYDSGFSVICGVDEAGRGPLAGPVCAAACILPRGLEIEGLNDSKKLTEKRRDALYDVICEKAVAYGIAFATVDEIE
ncbi:MAG: ribonuclease HII, partial [Oscillospiraceae bacterium]|nr:ribonuclease HII [Oscillospiraceae bacterium]